MFVLHLVAAVGYVLVMEDTVKALEEKLAKLEAKIGKKSESTAGTSDSPPNTLPENPLRIEPESFLRRPAKVGWFGYGNLKVLQPLTSGVLSFKPKYCPRT